MIEIKGKANIKGKKTKNKILYIVYSLDWR